MDAQLGILTGARAGETLSFSQRAISVGRHPEVDLRFDPASDRAVSARHALLFYEDGNWYIRDLGSRNGTFVNDRPVREDLRLRNGDRITFGVQGPTVQFATDRASLTGFAAASPAARDSRGPSTVERLRIELVRRTRRYRAAAIGLVVVAAGVVGTILFLGDRQRAAWDRERTAMRLQIDSLHSAGSRAIESLEQQLSALTSSLRASELRIQELQEAIAAAESRGNIGEAEGLRRELLAESTGLRNRQVAAGLDFELIQDRNRHAVARIFVEYESGEVATATAFAIRPDATLLTSRHVMVDAQGVLRPRRIAVQFSDSEQVWPARLLAVSDADLALVKVDNILGRVPVVHGLNLRGDTLPPGSPVAMIGFPHGGAVADPDLTVGYARPLLSAGVIQETSPTRFRVQGYGAVGASGSPVLDANGDVVAIVFGGRAEPDGHSVYAVPAAAAERLLTEVF
ncbi:MAG TPA: FHA domain-containing protein [Longimicrobiaceae bacterium]